MGRPACAAPAAVDSRTCEITPASGWLNSATSSQPIARLAPETNRARNHVRRPSINATTQRMIAVPAARIPAIARTSRSPGMLPTSGASLKIVRAATARTTSKMAIKKNQKIAGVAGEGSVHTFRYRREPLATSLYVIVCRRPAWVPEDGKTETSSSTLGGTTLRFTRSFWPATSGIYSTADSVRVKKPIHSTRYSYGHYPHPSIPSNRRSGSSIFSLALRWRIRPGAFGFHPPQSYRQIGVIPCVWLEQRRNPPGVVPRISALRAPWMNMQ